MAPPAPPPPTQAVAQPRQSTENYVPYTPATQPAPLPPATVDALPTSPRDPQPSPSLYYTIEIWEVLLPRQSISRDDAFWKRVNEQVIDLPSHDRLDKNGIRVGALPIADINYLAELIAQRKGTKTTLNGLQGRQIELPVSKDVDGQTLLFIDREGDLVGKWYDRCSNLLYFAFEPVPRRPNRIRLALTPAVRMQNRKLIYTPIPGKPDREVKYAGEESIYDANLVLDLPLADVLVVAPSLEARDRTTLGHAFLIQQTPAEQRERLIVVIPRAFQRADEAAATAER